MAEVEQALVGAARGVEEPEGVEEGGDKSRADGDDAGVAVVDEVVEQGD